MDDICLHSSNIKSVFKMLADLLMNGKRYRLTIKIWKDKRSIDQNSLSHMWYADLAKQANEKDSASKYTLKSVKQELKEIFLGYEQVEVTSITTGKTTYKYELKKTSKLDKGEMHYYLQQVEAWAYQNGFELRIPSECEYRKLQEEQNK